MAGMEALIFDLDGVLVNTADLHARSWEALAQQNSLSWARENFTRFRGRRQRDCLIDLFAPRALTEAEIDALLALKNGAYRELLLQTPQHHLVMPGAVELVEAGLRHRLKLAVASSSVNARLVLRLAGLHEMMDIVADGSVVVCGKPAPDIFLWTAGALRTRPAQCIVFEDSEVGVAGAVRAGMYVVGIGQRDALKEASIVLPGIDALVLEDLLHASKQHCAVMSVETDPTESEELEC